ncbi:hypothetical protein DFH06DRAFT_1145011 [Mycena polygramma]|nr:hypothetical protein DFH06DRAFT_1145011 [Mycena polygramma]
MNISTIYPEIIQQTTAALSRCPNLNILRLYLCSTHFWDMLRDAHFPKLHTFQYSAAPDASSVLPAFINRHPTITALEVFRGGPGPKFTVDPIHLPNLEKFGGNTFFAPSITSENNALWLAHLSWYGDEGDNNYTAILEPLGKMACQGNHGLVIDAEEVRLESFLECVAASMPRITLLAFQKRAERLSFLRNFHSLAVLEFHDFEDDFGTESFNLQIMDLQFVRMWGVNCPSLVSIILLERWKPVGTYGLYLER